MTSVQLNFYYNVVTNCGDDAIKGVTDPITDFHMPVGVSMVGQDLVDAFLRDIGSDGAWIGLENIGSPIRRDQPFFEASTAFIGTGIVNF